MDEHKQKELLQQQLAALKQRTAELRKTLEPELSEEAADNRLSRMKSARRRRRSQRYVQAY